jgi:nucleotide-binding universal stress UspA family protein
MYSRILVPLDGSHLAERSIIHAAEFARIFGACLILLRVMDPSTLGENLSSLEPFSWQIRKAEADLYLKNTASQLQNTLGNNIETVLLEGRTAETIIDYIQNNSIDLLAISTHGASGLSRWNTSSVFQKVVNKAYQHILIIRAYQGEENILEPQVETSVSVQNELTSAVVLPQPGIDYLATTPETPSSVSITGSLESEAVEGPQLLEKRLYQRILIPVDSSRRAECALTAASSLAEGTGASIVLTSVLHRPEVPYPAERTSEMKELSDRMMEIGRQTMQEYLVSLQSRLNVPSETQIIEEDSIPHGLHQAVEDASASLVVFCAHGQTGRMDWPYGSVVQNYIEYGNRPVLIVQDMPREQVRPTAAEEAAGKYGRR